MSDEAVLNQSLMELIGATLESPNEVALRTKTGFDEARFARALKTATENGFVCCQGGVVHPTGRLFGQPRPLPRRLRRYHLAAQPLWKGIVAAVGTVAITAFVMYAVLHIHKQIENFDTTWRIIKVFTSLLAAGFGVFLTGMLEVTYDSNSAPQKPQWFIHATGAFAMFVLVFFFM